MPAQIRTARRVVVFVAIAVVASCGREGTGLVGRVDHAESASDGTTKIVIEVMNTRPGPVSGRCSVTRLGRGQTPKTVAVPVRDVPPKNTILRGAPFRSLPGRVGYEVDCNRDGAPDLWPVLTSDEAQRTAAPTAASTTNVFGIDCESKLLSVEGHMSFSGTSALDAGRRAADRRLKDYDSLHEERGGEIVAMKDDRRIARFRTRRVSQETYRAERAAICPYDEREETSP